jgi:hypothetical protein
MRHVDEALQKQVESMLAPLSEFGVDAKVIARKIFDETKAEAQSRYGANIYAEDFGHKAIANAAFMADREAAGLTKDDILAYWNRPMLLGLLEMKVREFADFVSADVVRQQGRDLQQFARDRRMSMPTYGNPKSWIPSDSMNQGLTAEDADLNPEFALRVGRWQEATSVKETKERAKKFQSFNGLVRDLVRQGII